MTKLLLTWMVPVAALAVSGIGSLPAETDGRAVSYPAGQVTAKGYLALPEGGETAKRPGVLVVHEWWGHNAYVRKRADMLAEMGYVALAVDMYGDGKTAEHPKDAGAFAGEVRKNAEEARARFEGALSFLAAQPGVDPDKIAAIGYCFGGSVVLQMAFDGVKGLDAVASFHGSLGGLRFPDGAPKAKILVCHGAADPFISAEDIAAFKSAMKEEGADSKFVDYEGASHSFTNPEADAFAKKFDMPIGYDAKADKASWAELTAFLKSVFADG